MSKAQKKEGPGLNPQAYDQEPCIRTTEDTGKHKLQSESTELNHFAKRRELDGFDIVHQLQGKIDELKVEKEEVEKSNVTLQEENARAKAELEQYHATVRYPVFQNKDGNSYFELSSHRRVTIQKFNGAKMVDIREYFEDMRGNMKPMKKGIMLPIYQWDTLRDLCTSGQIDEILNNLGE